MAIEITQDLEATECCSCGVLFMVPTVLINHARKNGGFLHCPNGHSIGWSQGKVERELERTKLDLEGYKKRNATLSSKVSCLENSNRAFKAANTRLKNQRKEIA